MNLTKEELAIWDKLVEGLIYDAWPPKADTAIPDGHAAAGHAVLAADEVIRLRRQRTGPAGRSDD
jgi:hypothetical protein